MVSFVGVTNKIIIRLTLASKAKDETGDTGLANLAAAESALFIKNNNALSEQIEKKIKVLTLTLHELLKQGIYRIVMTRNE